MQAYDLARYLIGSMPLFKPFKTPLLQRRPATDQPVLADIREPSSKRRKLSSDDDDIVPESPPRPTLQAGSPRQPFRSVENVRPEAQHKPGQILDGTDRQAYTVLWRKISNKKHKTWDGDGTLVVQAGYATLSDDRGKNIGRIACATRLVPGALLSMSGKDVEIDSVLAKSVVPRPDPIPVVLNSAIASKDILPMSQTQARVANLAAKPLLPSHAHFKASLPAKSIPRSGPAFKPLMPPANKARAVGQLQEPTPRHDPNAKGALVLKRPEATSGKTIVDVVVDPLLGKHLREHQRAGVSFLYECVMGLRSFTGEGAILADEMGLGKTLQTITLIWTLLKQTPYHGEQSVARKAIVVCPKSVQANWKKEIYKWLGRERIGVLVANDRSRIKSFTKGKSYDVMIIGYEMLNLVQDLLHKAPLDLVVLDEGHRLKTAKNKTALAIKSLNTERRILLSGTPIQNDLSELYHIVDLVNPGLLGKYSDFKRTRELPILRGSQQDATEEERENGRACREQLDDDTSQFMLRRTADVLTRYLPPKTEYVVFCRPTDAQVSVYDAILRPGTQTESKSIFDAALKSSDMTLKLINVLKKVCNSPSLLSKDSAEEEEGSIGQQLAEKLPQRVLKNTVASSKLSLLDEMLHTIRSTTDEKVVVVSNYTSTLDLIQGLLTALDYGFLRLDGTTPSGKRQELVDTFNRSPAKKHFVFLLSTKAGGLGLNLIGASRLVLFDIDWNPSPDQQAMARICRDGQKRPCFIYRLVTKGALDEKIFQRQITKMGLADSVIDGKKSTTSSFSRDELRDLFTLDQRRSCQTHDLLGCDCAQDGCALDDAAAMTTEPGDGDDDVDDEDQDLPDADALVSTLTRPNTPSFQPAATQMAALEQQEAKAQKELRDEKRRMLALLQYSHVDAIAARKAAGEAEKSAGTTALDDAMSEAEQDCEYGIGDGILRKVMLDQTSRIDYVFCKASKGKLADVDAEAA